MKQKNFLKIALFFLFGFLTTIINAQIYNADFSNDGDGFADHTTSSPPAAAPASVGPFGSANNQWSLSYTSTPSSDTSANSFKVSGGSLVSDDWGGQGIFQSQSIDVSALNSVDISAITVNSGANDNNFKYFYILDGGSRVETANITSNNGDPLNYSITVDVSGANSIVVGFEFDENGGGDGYTTSSFTVSETPVATPGITLGAVSGNTSEDGTQATFTVVLNTQPTTDVVLNVTSGDTGEVTVDLATLTFTNANWDTPQTVTATGIDDAIQDGSIDVTITISVDDGLSDDAYDAVADVTTTITNEDDDFPTIIISEIMYNTPSTDDEWIELYNANGSSVDISGWTLEYNSNTFTFPGSTTFADNSYIVIAVGSNGDDTFNIDNPFTPDFNNLSVTNELVASTSSTNKLPNSTNTVALKSSGTTIDSVTYSSSDISSTNGSGSSYEIISTGSDNSATSSNWQASAINGGSPKRISGTVWTGATSSDWLVGNFSNGLPTTTSDVSIPAGLTFYPTVSSAITVNAINIESGATLIATNTFTGTVNYNRTLDNDSQWYLMSSPVVGEMYDDAWNTANSIDNGQGNNRGVSWYDNSSSDGTTGHWRYLQATNSGTFNVGQGYSIRLSTSGDVSFVGSGIYTSDQTFALTQGANNFNLIGNPFTGFITLGTFEATNGSVIEDEYYFWTGSAYVTRNNNNDSAFEIAPGQGFFVEATSANNVTFQVSDVSHGSETFNTKTSNIRPEIHLSVIEGAKTIPVRILYTEGTTRGFDTGYDGKLFSGASSDFMAYSDLVESNGIKYQTQVLPNQDHENMVIPVGLIAEAGKEITFTAEALNIPNGLQVYLEDRVTGAITRLDETNSEYKVTLTENLDGVGRFYLHTKSSAVLSTDDLALQGVQIFASTHRTLEVTGVNSTKATLKLYNILGKQVMQTSFSSTGKSTLNLPNLSTGVYIVQLSTDKGQLNKKIVLE